MIHSGFSSNREFVGHEDFSWCIHKISLDYWRANGVILEKAHRVKLITKWGVKFHMPICGSTVEHQESHHQEAPVGWPQCKRCSRHKGMSIPKVFEEALLESFKRKASSDT